MQLQRNGADSTHVGGNILTGGAVAARRRADQHAIFIKNAHRQAIKLQLTAPGQLIAAVQAVLNALVERQEALFVKNVIQRQHRHFVANLTKGRQRPCTDALSG